MDKDNIWTSLTVLALGLLVLAPLGALISSAILSQYWDWFIARDYGSGPSWAAWFGIAQILTTLVALATVNIERKKRTAWEDVIVAGSVWLGMLMGLGIAGLAGKIVGWL